MTHPLSITALQAAAARAAHPLVDGAPTIFTDPLAETLLGDRARELIGYHHAYGAHPILAGARAQTLCRSRYVESRVARADLGQYVILGAGLDSYAYRSDAPPRVFEVDDHGMQEWKLRRIGEAGVPVPPAVRHVPLDLETGSLVDGLRQGGFDPASPALVSWLGVTMYLTPDAVGRTLEAIGRWAPGTEVVLDYLVPERMRDEAGRAYASAVAAVAGEQGEPWRTFLTPEQAAGLLARHGLEVVEDLPLGRTIEAELWERDDALRPAELLRVVRARVSGRAGEEQLGAAGRIVGEREVAAAG
ncbi:class I SAM-dependent methyltransferase [Actinoplanes aureus]|uniref:S-adenosyl-L-methionine-dependent methyltransferase n=1 Tax=Actinoplanes aureus TaxID=2792083 RepID=A0A931C3K8_9ACTN|nr:class I SAM-dependent methyltransferase [Actinoplanes aureus]MBG0562760.1 class I SAM-dependent methyltransferase [Actinoplanes aureus]